MLPGEECRASVRFDTVGMWVTLSDTSSSESQELQGLASQGTMAGDYHGGLWVISEPCPHSFLLVVTAITCHSHSWFRVYFVLGAVEVS